MGKPQSQVRERTLNFLLIILHIPGAAGLGGESFVCMCLFIFERQVLVKFSMVIFIIGLNTSDLQPYLACPGLTVSSHNQGLQVKYWFSDSESSNGMIPETN